jgi:uncharacterized protein (DUF305 family)
MRTRIAIGLTLALIAALGLSAATIAVAQGPGSWGHGLGGMLPGAMWGHGPGGAHWTGAPSRTWQPDAAQPFDLRFLDEMIVHHQMGVVMTQHMVNDSPRAEMRDLANRIITAQQREIAQMQAWRREWYPNAPATSWPGGMMGPGMLGPGMMGAGVMRQMHPGADLDRMFIQMMIPHHEDAITLAREALASAEHEEIRKLSGAIISTQAEEIVEMRQYLADWYNIR